jgi:hypothetical protein
MVGRGFGFQRDDVLLNYHPDPHLCWSMLFSEKRYPLFGIMLYAFCIATPELVVMSTPLVSRRNRAPTTSVINATPIGYHRPA